MVREMCFVQCAWIWWETEIAEEGGEIEIKQCKVPLNIVTPAPISPIYPGVPFEKATRTEFSEPFTGNVSRIFLVLCAFHKDAG
jgi:hypothetical protein